MTSSWIWRSTDGQESAAKQGLKSAAGTDLIEFSIKNVTSGKYIHQTELGIVVAIGDNEKPQGNVNELQDVGVDSITWTITGSVSLEQFPSTNAVFQKVKTWLLDGKVDDVFTKGRFGLELADLSIYNLVPTGTGATPEQPRGYMLTNWSWIRSGQTPGKVEFIATLRFNGDVGVSPTYSWTVNH
jgi:hypothetical protein